MTHQLISREERVSSTRGLVCVHNHRNAPLRLVNIQRWMRYTRLVLNAEKVDVLAYGSTTALLPDLLACGTEIGCRVSLRTDATSPPRDLAAAKAAGLWDLLLCPSSLKDATFRNWLVEAHAADVPIRLQLAWAALNDETVPLLATLAMDFGIRHVSIVPGDAFATTDEPPAHRDITALVPSLIRQLETNGTEVSVHGLPFCSVDEGVWPNLLNSRQRALDHNHYIPTAWTLAKSIYRHRVYMAEKMIRMLLGRHTLSRNPVDEILLPFVINRSHRYLVNRLVRRLTEHLNVTKSVPKALQRSKYDEVLQEKAELDSIYIPLACESCRLRKICDHNSLNGAPLLNHFAAKPIDGELVVSPLHFAEVQPKYYDAVDALRADDLAQPQELADEALHILTQTQPTRAYTSADYKVIDCFSEQMEGGLKWWSVTNTEKLSTPLGTFTPPLTISVEVGAGIADYIGFSFGRHCKIVCPMEAYRHTLSLHVNAEGRYVVLRDGKAVPPVAFDGTHNLPLRLGEVLQPQLSIWNIDDCVLTQGLKIWNDAKPIEAPPAKYSVIIVSTKFTRRLQAVLRNIAHQQGIDISQIEIIVAYVPGLDATDDLIDSLNLTFPELRIVRSPFAEKHATAKGLLINESFKLSQGEWIMLLDSDTLLPPDYFARIEAVSDTEHFIAPDGRRLLTRETTARILLGEIEPWNTWDSLLSDAGEFRHRETRGIPVGFCQCFRAEYLTKHPYLEMDHFEIADMHFSMDVLKDIGEEHRLSGAPVLHLDHGGSQWYGTKKHM